ncbi:MAG: type I restriction endonuclease subunit R, partial [Planctomycetes bacterium]|nr:type I restriction endonuclease subunit R [Planctomycetota bacterium]
GCARPEGVDTLRRNMAFHAVLTRGVELRVAWEGGKVEHRHIYAVDWENPEKNDFLVVNQLSVSGKNDRRPDVVIYVNGIPLVVFELKNPYDEHPTVDDALNQIAHYRHDISQLFEFNAVTVVSDGITTLHGPWTAAKEWYCPWKSIDGRDVEPNTTGSMKTLIEGLFSKDRLLDYVRHFIVFEVANEVITKKAARYHQYFAVRLAVERTIAAFTATGEKRLGVIWHATGSGKSLSMAFLVGILRRRAELENPTFVIQVDRTDLDSQLFGQFVEARSLVGDVKQADSVDDLRKLLRTKGGEVVFTTIEKFRLKRDDEGGKEIEHPVLSERSNVIVIADEAHRSQYGFTAGFARYLAEALPNARRLGFTGTPISFSGADTIEVFGEYIHTYDMAQSKEDKATVPIYYSPRQVQLHLNDEDIDRALAEITDGYEVDELERRKSRWAALAKAASAVDRLNTLARDLLEYHRDRTATLDGKAMIVCMTRENCVRLYDALTALTGCPEVRIIMTGDITKDPEAWNEAGHITTKAAREALKERLRDIDDPLKMVIVCDMWLTGTNIPCLHTLYVDKPMRGHNLVQAISRVNRVFRDKPHGLIVDYIGIGDDLREATATYTRGGGRGDPAPSVEAEARPLFQDTLAEIRRQLPEGIDYGDWRTLDRIDLEDRYAGVYGYLTEYEERRDLFLQVEHRLSSAFLLVKHFDDCRAFADEIIFYQRVRKQLIKAIPGRKPPADLDQAVRDLVDDSVESEGVVDIFKSAGIEHADISILDDAFLQTFKDQPMENLRLKLLEKLVRDEIRRRQPKNLAKAKSFRELLEDTLQRYHNRLIDAAAVIRAMIAIRQEMERDDQRAAELGLGEDELAFYDAVAANLGELYDEKGLSGLIHDVVQTVKRNLRVDWTEPHREDVKASVRAAVKRVLRARGVGAEHFDAIVGQIMEQAEAMYADWPLAA